MHSPQVCECTVWSSDTLDCGAAVSVEGLHFLIAFNCFNLPSNASKDARLKTCDLLIDDKAVLFVH